MRAKASSEFVSQLIWPHCTMTLSLQSIARRTHNTQYHKLSLNSDCPFPGPTVLRTVIFTSCTIAKTIQHIRKDCITVILGLVQVSGAQGKDEASASQLSQDPSFGYLLAHLPLRQEFHYIALDVPKLTLRLSWPQPPSNSDSRGMSLILRIQSEMCNISTCKSTVHSGLLVCLLFQSS